MKASLAAFFVFSVHAQVANTTRVTPFVVYKHEGHYAKDPKLPPNLFDSMYARRSDGSWRHTFTAQAPSHDLSAAQVIEFLDFRTRTEVILEPFTRSAIVFHLTDGEARSERERVPDCSAVPEVSVNPPTASGVRMLAYGVTRVVRKEDDDTMDTWVAPALDCYPLQETETFTTGPHNSRIVYKVEPGEPPAAFFEIPPEYINRSPRQLEVEYKFLFGEAFWGEPAASNVQQRYERSLDLSRFQ